MSNSQEEQKLEYLTEGSVWMNNRGRTVTALMITNTDEAIPEAFKRKNPPQVVCVSDSSGQLLSFSLETFLAKYEFHNVNADIEAKTTLYVESLNDPKIILANTMEGDQERVAAPEASESDDADDADVDEGAASEDLESDHSDIHTDSLISFIKASEAEPLLDSVRLASLIVSASLQPQFIGSGVTRRQSYRLALTLNPKITNDMMRLVSAAVDPSISNVYFNGVVLNGEALTDLEFVGYGSEYVGLDVTRVLYFQESGKKKKEPSTTPVQATTPVQVQLQPVQPEESDTDTSSETEIPVQ